jgi:CubicO group peptidase (beta-lactamase class C family)
VDRGLLSYSDTVAQHWPEFGRQGKAQITVADVLRHEAGLVRFHRSATPEDAVDWDSMAALIEESPRIEFMSKYTPPPNPEATTGRRGYHAVSRGLILNCLLLRVDPMTRSMSQFLAEEVAGPLKADVFCGMPEALQDAHHIADMAPFILRWSKRDPQHKETLSSLDIGRIAEEGAHRDGTVNYMGAANGGVQNSIFSREIVSPSTNGHASARGLAKIAAAMAAKGSFGGVELMAEATFDDAHAEVVHKYDDILLEDSRFAQGGFAEFRLDFCDRATSEGRGSLIGGCDTQDLGGSFYGWGGAGGSAFIWSPQHEVGFSYTMNGMASYILGGPRTLRIFDALCVLLKQLK